MEALYSLCHTLIDHRCFTQKFRIINWALDVAELGTSASYLLRPRWGTQYVELEIVG